MGTAAAGAEGLGGMEGSGTAPGGLGAATGAAVTGFGAGGTAATGGLGAGTGMPAAGLGGMGGVAGAAGAPGGGGMAAAGAAGLGMAGMLKGLGGGGGTAEPGAGGIPGLGGAGMVGGAPAAVGRGLGGRLIMAASRGLAAPGLPSRRGGRTMRTVSFLGSFMAGDYYCGRGGMEPAIPTGRRELSGVRRVSNVSRSGWKKCGCGELLLACRSPAGHSPRPFFRPMAKTAWKEREKRKRKTVDKYAELRAELKKKGDYLALSQLPRNASPVRLSNRCRVSGRKRAYIREFQMSRLTFRELACAGLIPGVTKASW